MPRTYKFQFEVICSSQGTPNLPKVENMINLSMQELIYDDEFVAALDESEAVSIQVLPLFGNTDG